MCIGGERFQIAHAIMTRADFEVIAESQGAQRGIAAGAPASNGGARRIGQILFRQIFGGVRAILHIHSAPLQVQPFAILPAVAAASAIVDIRYRKAAAGPELNLQIQRARSGRGRPAVGLDEQWGNSSEGAAKAGLCGG